MKRLPLLFLCLLFGAYASAWNYESTEKTQSQSVQLRAEAEFAKKFDYGLKLSFAEDLRFNMFDQSWLATPSPFSPTSSVFSKSQTTVMLSYSPIQHLKLDAGYTLKIVGDNDWSDVNEWLRHRFFASVAGSYKVDKWKFSLRERVLCELRTDSVNPAEKSQAAWMLRSKLEVQYSIFGQPLKPYAWVELVNTLNAPEYQMKYKDNNPSNKGMQYIRKVRTSLGISWRLDKSNSLNFYYQFNYGYDRDVNITKKKKLIELTEETSFVHAIGIKYDFGW